MDQLLDKLCKISMCDPDVSLSDEDIDFIIDNNALGVGSDGAENFVIEFANHNPVFTIATGQKIHEDDIIGYISGIPVKSRVNGTITEVNKRYVIGRYTSSIEDITKEFMENGAISTEKILSKFGLSQKDIQTEKTQDISTNEQHTRFEIDVNKKEIETPEKIESVQNVDVKQPTIKSV